MESKLTPLAGAAVACIGTGLVGSAWACVFARGGHEVRLHDAGGPAALAAARQRVADMLSVLAKADMLHEPAAAILARLRSCPDLETALAGVAYVQESASEDLAAKTALFQRFTDLTAPDTILASSTSALPGSSFMTMAGPERALVVHPVNPPAFIPLVELCGNGQTSDTTIDRVRDFMSALGMRPVTLRREIDGFLLNRLQFALVAEAMHLVGEGYCTPEDIDAVMTDGLALRWATIGPFAVAHLNATDGFQGFVDRLGPMMRRLGADAHTDYDWTPDMARDIHARMTAKIPLPELPERVAARDRGILAVRRLQSRAE